MAKFKLGDTVYHKATLEEGVVSEVISETGEAIYLIIWRSGDGGNHNEDELYTEEEYNREHNPEA